MRFAKNEDYGASSVMAVRCLCSFSRRSTTKRRRGALLLLPLYLSRDVNEASPCDPVKQTKRLNKSGPVYRMLCRSSSCFLCLRSCQWRYRWPSQRRFLFVVDQLIFLENLLLWGAADCW